MGKVEVKVKIDTDLRMVSTGAVRKNLAENASNFDPRKFLKGATKGMSDICKNRYEAFGVTDMASKITKRQFELTTRKPRSSNRCANTQTMPALVCMLTYKRENVV